MKRIALFFVMKVINLFSLECEVLDLLTPKPIPAPVPVDIMPEREVKKIIEKKQKELPKKPLLKKKAKTK